MNHFPWLCSLIGASLFLSTVSRAEDARAVMDKVNEMRQLAGTEGISSLTIYNAKGRKRERKIAMITKLYDDGKTEKKLSRFLAPADVKGTGFLSFDYEKKDDDMWIFLPALRKTRRIVSSEKAKSFMGSEFAYQDLNVPNLDDYQFKLLRQEKLGQVDCWVIESKPKTEEIAEDEGYAKRVLWVGKTDYNIRKALYYDLDNKLLKELITKEIKLVEPKTKRYRPMYLEMVNKQNGRRSVMKIEKLEVSPKVKDEYFTTRYLERV